MSHHRIVGLGVVVGLVALCAAGGSSPCEEASGRLGRRVCVHDVRDDATWRAIAVGRTPQVRFLVPATDAARLPTLFVDGHTFEYHYDFLTKAFPALFPGLRETDYARLILNDARREFYGGNVLKIGYGWQFTVEAVASSPIDADDVRRVWTALQLHFALGDLAYKPTGAQIEALTGWPALPCAVAGAEPRPAYELYVAGETIGTLRHLSAADLDAGAFGPTDILALDGAPFDIERPIAGVITGTRQGELSHVNVRSNARGTPSCFTDVASLAAWDGKLVRLACADDGLHVAAASPDEVLAFWSARRPAPVPVIAPELVTGALVGLDALPIGDAAARRLAVGTYGSKATNLAILVQRVPNADWAKDGFAIPFAAYAAFVRRGGWTVDLGDGPAFHTFGQTLDVWLAEPEFRADAAIRRERLLALQDAMAHADVDPLWVERIRDRIVERFGADVMVRFRSSSNAEDSLLFSGAGLYESTSVCAADDRDADDAGPSRCDAATKSERGVARGLAKVWASLWGVRAFEERDWYGVEHARVAMGVLVDRRAAHEQANIVAFTGDPNGGSAVTIDAQAGELAVVSADPGVWPEQDALTMKDGAVAAIARTRASSEAPLVLSDAQLRELGLGLESVKAAFPIDEAPPDGHDVVIDTEWKILEDGRLVIKQARPFLR